ncbi:hypothetical protein [Pseudomonas sp. BN102]|uniref:hypothetical protein n=1 Tax=Pseudomonas sp. BN102 TaxID=2567886 RepID=UPI002454BF67|nr:hypothetical protein [Pseudomonas sp. BN102]MDH4612443.1 hypothetical protein [Pseudomonas sp. BN102]
MGGECFVGFDQGATGASFASNYQDIDGIIVPMSRRVFAYDAAGMKVDSPLLVSIDFHSVAWRKDQVLGRAGCDFNGHWVTGGFPEKIQSLLMGSTSPVCR